MADPTQQNRQAIGDFIANILPNSPISSSLGPEARAKAELQAQNEAELAAIQAQGGQASIPFQDAPSQPMPAPMPAQSAPTPIPTRLDRSEIATGQPQPQVQTTPVVASPTINIDKQQKAIEDAAKAGASAAKEEQAFLQGFQKEEVLAAQAQANLDATREEFILKEMGKAQETLDNLATKKIKPENLFSDNSFWNKFATIAIATLGGPGTVKIMQDRINSDIALQEKQLDSAYTAAAKKQSYLQELRSVYKDSRSAKEALRAGMYQAAQMKLQEVASKTKNADVQAKAANSIAELEISKQEALSKIAENAKNQNQSAQMQATDPTLAKILALPKGLQEKALKEYDEVGKVNSQIPRLRKVMQELSSLQTVKRRVGDPVQSLNLLEKAESDLFPIVKAIVGERMTDSDARILIKSNLPKLTDSDATKMKKASDMEAALKAKAAGETSILRGLGILKNPLKSKEDN